MSIDRERERPAQGELAELMRLLRDRVDPAIQMAAGERFDRFLAELDTIRSLEGADLTPIGSALRPDRWQDTVIEQEIPEGASVLDLGCGDGELLARLRDLKTVRGQGVELDAEQVAVCVSRGVPVFQADLDEGLKGFPERCFDYVVLEETLQTLHRPMAVLAEMLRVGRCCIASFPNFGHWRVRLDLAVRGRMPVSPRLPYRWFDTPNIHHLTLRDFLDWTKDVGATVDKAFALVDGSVRPFRTGDNLHAAEVLFFFHRSA